MDNRTEESQGTAVSVAHFTWIDHGVFGMMLLISTVVGVLIGIIGKQKTKVDYLLGGKTMGTLPVAVSLIFSHLSGITLMGMPAEYYTYGTQFYMVNVASLTTAVIFNYLFLPIFFNLQLTSTYEYLELRFNKSVRQMASFLFIANLLLYLPLVIYVPALALNHVSGINVHFITTTVTGICALYTMLGGIKAVVWTDFLQSFVTIGSSVAVITLGVIKVGGFGEVWKRNEEGQRIEFFNMDLDPLARNTFWTIWIGTTFQWLSSLGVNQSMIQKFITLPSLRNARLALLVFCIGIFIMKTLSLIVGMIIYAAYENCDPIEAKLVSKPDQILPYFTLDAAASLPGLSGLFIAGIFSAGLSTMSSYLNCIAATTYEDFILPRIQHNKKILEKGHIIMKVTVLVVGVVVISMVFLVERLGAVLQLAISFAGICQGPTLGVFTIGMIFPWANAKGTLAGTIVGLFFMAWVVTGAYVTEAVGTKRFPFLPMSTDGCSEMFNITVPTSPSASPTPAADGTGHDAFFMYKISYMYYVTVGFIVVMVVGMAVSYFTGFTDPKQVESRLLVPFMQKYGKQEKEKDQSTKELLTISNGNGNVLKEERTYEFKDDEDM